MIFERVALLTGKLQEMRIFYNKTLGFDLIGEGGDYFTIQAGNTALTFTSASDGQEPFYHFAFNVPENRFAEAKSWAVSKAPLIQENGDDEVYFASWNAHSVYFEDPSGNIVELIARHNLPCRAEHSFTVQDIIGVSEIGIVATEVIFMVNQLNDSGLPNWRDIDKDFTLVGDEYGLMIVVKKDREWFFSNHKKAHFYPVEVTVAGGKTYKFLQQNQLLLD